MGKNYLLTDKEMKEVYSPKVYRFLKGYPSKVRLPNKVNFPKLKKLRGLNESFLINSKDLIDKDKNPNFILSAKEILKNKKIRRRQL